MHPILFQLGPVTIYTYGVLVSSGVLLGLWYARRQAPRVGLHPNRVWNLGIYMVFGALIVSKLWLFASDWKFYRANPGEIFSIASLQSAGTFYGGLIGALLVLAWRAYIEPMPVLSVLDVFAAAAPLSHAIGRLGCFAAGCCYGKPTSLPWAVTFRSDAANEVAGTPLHTPLHPTQLYEAGAEFINFLLLMWLGARQRFTGQMIGTYFILYGLERATIEVFRGDPGRTLLLHGNISLMQIVSLGFVVAGALLWWRGLRRMGLSAAAVPARAVAGR
jgi:phosphatidylglycerol---prolipoprotein diacylglyceryl transferase